MRKRILVIEDDTGIRRGLVDALTLSGYEVLESARGDSGLESAVRDAYDLLLLDLVLPRRDGLSILEEVRRVRPTTAVIILTARGEEEERVRGFRLGADDYVVKPFSLQELLARVEAVLRRSPERPLEVRQVRWAGGAVDLERSEMKTAAGELVALSERERDLLRYLASNASRTVTREELLQRLWQCDPRGVETRTIDMHVARLREKLGDDPADPCVVLTVRGQGYKIGDVEVA